MNRNRTSVMPALTLALAMGACTQTPEPQSQAAAARGDAVEGRRLAEVYCASCHAIGPEAESRHPAAPPFRALSRDYPVNTLEEAFAEGILVGHRDMPEFRLEPAQIDDLLSYIESIQERRGA
jgi:mono/diheme cytochrome c family protein